MRRFIVPVAALALVAAVLAFRPAPEATISVSDLAGAWTAVHVHAELQDTTWAREEDRPNILLFTDGHWASLRISGDGTREELPDEPTDEQLLEAWRPFRASAGSYTISGTVISSTTILAKNPNSMGNDWPSEFELDGVELVRVFTNEDSGNTWTVRYERMN